MPNKNYINGRRKEYAVMHKFKDLGMISFRSAGSHSPIDVIGIDTEKHIIKLIQCKPKDMSQNQKDLILEANKAMQGTFEVSFEVI
jgi:hypothetical protein